MNIENPTTMTIGIKNSGSFSPKIGISIKPEGQGDRQCIRRRMSSGGQVCCLICIDKESTTKFTGSGSAVSTNFLNIMTVREEWSVVFDPITAWLVKCPMGHHIGVLGDFLLNVSNRHGTRSCPQTIGVCTRICSKGNRYRTGPWITAYFKGVVTVRYLGETTAYNFTIGYRKIRLSKTGDCTRGNCGTLTELEINRFGIFPRNCRGDKIRCSTLTTQLV